MHLGLIGYGNIARTLMGVLARENAAISRVSVVSLPEFADATRTALAQDFAGESSVYTDSAPLIQARPDLVVECAGHAAVQAHATAVLRAGIEVLIVSIGALADAALLDAVERAAAEGAHHLARGRHRRGRYPVGVAPLGDRKRHLFGPQAAHGLVGHPGRGSSGPARADP